MKRVLMAMVLGLATFGVAGPAQALVAPRPPGGGPVGRPTPPPGWTYQWVPPAYRTVYDRTWVADQVRWVTDWVQVSPGRYEQVWRQVVTPGHWETTTRQVLVSNGYWQLVRVDLPRPGPFPPGPWNQPPVMWPSSPGTVGVEGYGARETEDLGKFSPLREWPRP
jgi:hypothetical protein